MRVSIAQTAWLWAILSGVCYVLCFPKWDMPWLSILFLPCLLASIHSMRSLRQALLISLALSCMVAWGGFAWIIYLAQNFGDFSLSTAIVIQWLFCLVAAPQMIAFCCLGFVCRFEVEKWPTFYRPLFWSFLYIGLEFLARFLKIFPEHLGNTQIYFSNLAQAASLGGVSLLGFLPIYAGASLFYWKKTKSVASVMVSVTLIFVIHFWGQYRINSLAARETTPLKVGLVQQLMHETDKVAQRSGGVQVVDQLITKLLEMSDTLATEKPDLIVWPETAYPMVFESSASNGGNYLARGYANLVRDRVRQLGIPLLFGGYESENGKEFNAGILLDKQGQTAGSYRKEILLVFGEYMPLQSIFPSLKELNPQMGDFGQGPGAIPLDFIHGSQRLLLGVNICYEAILPGYMRGFASQNAHVLINLTKDSWYGDTFEPWQHFQLAALRAIELGVPLIRATNTGLSGWVSPTGKVELLSQPYIETAKVITVDVPTKIEPTLYTALGEWFALLSLLASILGLGAALRSRRS